MASLVATVTSHEKSPVTFLERMREDSIFLCSVLGSDKCFYLEVGLFLLFSLLINLMSISRAVRLCKRDEYTGEGK